MRNQKGFTIVEAVLVALFIFGLGGWIANIVKIVSDFELAVTGMFIARCIGVFVAPLGAVLGYL